MEISDNHREREQQHNMLKTINRRKIYTRVVWLICLALHGYIQVHAQTKDSLSNAQYALDWSSIELHRMATDHFVWIDSEVKENFNVLEAVGKWHKGEWIAAQDASKIRALDLGTEGKTTWNGFALWGRFQYSRQMEDSTRLRHQTRINEDAPFYFGSLRKNYYERDIYTLGASIQRSFAGERLPVTLGLDYRIGNHFSNNDPRGRVQDFQFDTYLAVGYSHEKWNGHLKGLYGYGREAVSIGFKNDKYIQNTVDSLYVNWLMNGYGNAFQQIRDMFYTNNMQRYGVGVHLNKEINSDNTVFVNATYKKDRQFFRQDRVTPLTYESLSDYDRNTLSLDVLWKTKRNAYSNSLYSLSFEMLQGQDFNHSILKNNYVYYQQSAQARAIWRLREFQFAASLNYVTSSTEDGLTGNLLEYTHLSPDLAAGMALSLSPQYVLYPSVHIGYNAVLNDKLILPETNSGIFAKTKIYHDYLYYSTASYFMGLSVDLLNSAFSKRNQWKIGARVDYARQTGFETYTFDPPTTPGVGRFASNLVFSVYF